MSSSESITIYIQFLQAYNPRLTVYPHYSPIGLNSVMNIYVDIIGNEFFFLFSFITNILYKL